MAWRRIHRVAMALLTVASLAGCTDAITIHPIASYRDPDPHVPPVVGRWVADVDGSKATLQVEGNPEDRGRCRELSVHYQEGRDDVTLVGNEVCFVEIDGNVVAEVRVGEPYEVYRQYLVRVSEDRIQTCSLWPVWVLLDELSSSGPTGYALDTLQYTVRERGDNELMVFISKPKELREFLEVALPELVSACDNSDGGVAWISFERAPPDEESEVPETGGD